MLKTNQEFIEFSKVDLKNNQLCGQVLNHLGLFETFKIEDNELTILTFEDDIVIPIGSDAWNFYKQVVTQVEDETQVHTIKHILAGVYQTTFETISLMLQWDNLDELQELIKVIVKHNINHVHMELDRGRIIVSIENISTINSSTRGAYTTIYASLNINLPVTRLIMSEMMVSLSKIVNTYAHSLSEIVSNTINSAEDKFSSPIRDENLRVIDNKIDTYKLNNALTTQVTAWLLAQDIKELQTQEKR